MRRKKESFLDLLEYYFDTYLPVAKGLSKATITSYKASFRMLLEFMNSVKSVPPDKVGFDILDNKMISDFLGWLETERGCSTVCVVRFCIICPEPGLWFCINVQEQCIKDTQKERITYGKKLFYT